MDMVTVIVGGALILLLVWFLLRLSYIIMQNLINGRKFHQSLLQELNHLRLSKMLTALGINKTAYVYQTKVNDIHKQLESCSSCTNTDECDEKLSDSEINVSEIGFCDNEADLVEMVYDNTDSDESAGSIKT
jgi:hypothetical protein